MNRGRPWLAVAAFAAAVVLLAALLLTVWKEPVLGLFRSSDRLEELVTDLGPAGPCAIVLLQAAQVVLSPIPGQLVGLAAGLLYGPWLGTLYSMAGLMLGTLLAVWAVRRWGRPLIARLVSSTTLARIDRLAGRLGAPTLFLVFLLPFLPDDTILLVASLTDIPLRTILFVAAFGRLPGVLISSWLGAGATDLSLGQWAAVSAATLLVAAPIYYWRGALERWMWSLLRRVSPARGRRREREQGDTLRLP